MAIFILYHKNRKKTTANPQSTQSFKTRSDGNPGKAEEIFRSKRDDVRAKCNYKAVIECEVGAAR